jgi:hypothetical protein
VIVYLLLVADTILLASLTVYLVRGDRQHREQMDRLRSRSGVIR